MMISRSKWRPLKRSSMLNMLGQLHRRANLPRACPASAICTRARQTAWPDDRPADRQRRCAEGGVGGIHHDASSGDAVPRTASRRNGRASGHLAERRTHLWNLWYAAFCQDLTAGHRGRSQCRAGTLEQWSDGGTDQQVEDAQACHVWPCRRWPPSRTDDAVAGLKFAPRLKKTPIKYSATTAMTRQDSRRVHAAGAKILPVCAGLRHVAPFDQH